MKNDNTINNDKNDTSKYNRTRSIVFLFYLSTLILKYEQKIHVVYFLFPYNYWILEQYKLLAAETRLLKIKKNFFLTQFYKKKVILSKKSEYVNIINGT